MPGRPRPTLVITEVPPGSAEFETILASLNAADCAVVRPPKPNGRLSAGLERVERRGQWS